jgi:hypothetical protein
MLYNGKPCPKSKPNFPLIMEVIPGTHYVLCAVSRIFNRIIAYLTRETEHVTVEV